MSERLSSDTDPRWEAMLWSTVLLYQHQPHNLYYAIKKQSHICKIQRRSGDV